MLHNRRNFSGYEYYFLNDFSDICYLYVKALPFILLFPCAEKVKKKHFFLSSSTDRVSAVTETTFFFFI